MMRLSCLTLSYQNQFKAGKMDLFKFMDAIRALNFDGFDIHRRHITSTDKDYLKRVRRYALDSGLTTSSMCVTTEFGRSAEAVPGEIEKAREAIELGMFFGTPVLRVFVGSAPSPDKTEEAFKRGVDALHKVAEIGADMGSFGSAERRMGSVLRDKPRDSFVLSSKVGRLLRRRDRPPMRDRVCRRPRRRPLRHRRGSAVTRRTRCRRRRRRRRSRCRGRRCAAPVR